MKQYNYCAPRFYLASGFLLRAWWPIVFCSHFSWAHTYIIHLYIIHLYVLYIVYTLYYIYNTHLYIHLLQDLQPLYFVPLSKRRRTRWHFRRARCRYIIVLVAPLIYYRVEKKNKGWRIQKNARVPQTAGGRFRATIYYYHGINHACLQYVCLYIL